MPVEIEAKIKVEDLELVRTHLRELGARRAGKQLEVNAFFDTEDRSLLAADEGLRLRKAKELEGDGESVIMTFKGPRQHGILKSREEVELEVGEWDAAVTLLSRLGYDLVLSFEKRRETWELEGCKVELDELPLIGTYLEIEGPSEGKVLHVRDMLGLKERGIVKASYIALITAYLQETGRAETVVTFGG